MNRNYNRCKKLITCKCNVLKVSILTMTKQNATRYNGYNKVEKEFDWVQVRKESKSNSFLSKGKVKCRNEDGTYVVNMADGTVERNVPMDSIQKLAGTKRDNQEVYNSEVYRSGDIVLCKCVSNASKIQIAWYNPRTQEVQWNCPKPASRKFTVYESVAEMATNVKPIQQKSRRKTTENVPSEFKR